MATDCKKLSPNAQKFFERLKFHFPPDPWGKPRWQKRGKVNDNGWFDLRKNNDRDRLEKNVTKFLGYLVGMEAKIYQKKKGSLVGFENCRFSSKMFRSYADILLTLEELDYQIQMETIDLVER